MFPNFLVIGAAKAGTSTINAYLSNHPEVFMSPVKEPNFFAFGAGSGATIDPGLAVYAWVDSREEYLRLFDRRGDARMIGECSVSSLYCPGTAERIYRFNPDMRLIVSLRDPVERAYSSFNYAKSYGLEPLSSLAEGLKAERDRIRDDQSLLLRYRDLGLYARQLKRFRNVFPAEQIKVVLYEDLLSSPVDLIRELQGFLGVSVNVDQSVRFHMNPGRRPDDSNWLHRFVNDENLARATVRKLLPLSARLRMRELVRLHLFKPPPKMGDEERHSLQHLFTEDIKRLERLLERDFSSWLS